MSLLRTFSIAALALAVAAAATLWPRNESRPAVSQVSFTLLNGHKTQLGSLLGKVVLVNFWATSCAICVAEMPQVAALHDRHHVRGLETLAVAMPYDPPALVARYAESRRLPFGVVIDLDGAVTRAFGDVPGTPTFFVLDRRGRIAHRGVGPPDFAALDALITRLLAEA